MWLGHPRARITGVNPHDCLCTYLCSKFSLNNANDVSTANGFVTNQSKTQWFTVTSASLPTLWLFHHGSTGVSISALLVHAVVIWVEERKMVWLYIQLMPLLSWLEHHDFAFFSCVGSRNSLSDLPSRETKLLYVAPQSYKRLKTRATENFKGRTRNSARGISTVFCGPCRSLTQLRLRGQEADYQCMRLSNTLKQRMSVTEDCCHHLWAWPNMVRIHSPQRLLHGKLKSLVIVQTMSKGNPSVFQEEKDRKATSSRRI